MPGSNNPRPISLMKPALFAFFCLLASSSGCAAVPTTPDDQKGELLFQDDFAADLSAWVVEQTSAGTTKLLDGALVINDAAGPNDNGGCTVWFKENSPVHCSSNTTQPWFSSAAPTIASAI